MWFDVRVFDPFGTLWNSFVIQDESVYKVTVIVVFFFSILADSSKSTNLTFQVLGDQALLGSVDAIS